MFVVQNFGYFRVMTQMCSLIKTNNNDIKMFKNFEKYNNDITH